MLGDGTVDDGGSGEVCACWKHNEAITGCGAVGIARELGSTTPITPITDFKIVAENEPQLLAATAGRRS